MFSLQVEMNVLLRFEAGVEKMTASHFAAKEGFKLVLQELVQRGVDINIPTQFDRLTPLHLSCQHADNDVALSMTRMLVKAGGGVNAKDHCNRTPLISACEMGYLDIVILLLDQGAEMDQSSDREDFPVMVNWVQEYSPLLSHKALGEVSDPYNGNTALIQACREHRFDIVLELVERSCLLDITNLTGNTALHIAAKSQSRFLYIDEVITQRLPVIGHPEIVQVLVNIGANMNLVNKNQESALYRAVSSMAEIQSLEMEREIKIHCYELALQIVRILVTAGADTHIKGKDHTDKSLISLLLYIRVKQLGPYQVHLEDKLYTTVALFIMTGCSVCEQDLILCDQQSPLGDSTSSASTATPTRLYTGNPSTHSLDTNSSSGYSDMHGLLHAYFKVPAMLKQMARMSIRRSLPQPVSQSIRRLRLPSMLHTYVSLKLL